VLLIAEIGLTVWAWTRGWKAWALVPLAFGLFLSFVAGYMIGSFNPEMTEDEIADIVSYFIIADIAIVIILLVMAIVGKSKNSSPAV
jgi:hypothetical protein